MRTERHAITLAELCRRIGMAINSTPGISDVWITAETSDLRTSGGHCYMELLQKDGNGGTPLAKCRAVIWASTFARLSPAFHAATGSRLRSDMKIMAKVSANYHTVYGLTLVISDIDPSYTVGDLARRRMEIIAQLQDDGVYDLNRELLWSPTPNRIAVISAAGAAGYGDFVKHLYLNPYRLRFDTTLFTAALQGERTSASVIAALEAIMERVDDFDCVVIIRGGGAVSDLASFDDYELAFNVAQFPLPVVVGIGHERDTTVLDYVANTRVKTPTAAAEALIARMAEALQAVHSLGRDILDTVSDRLDGQHRQLAYYQGNLPALVQGILERNRRRTGPEVALALSTSVRNIIARRADRLTALGEVLDALSPEATLRRGYSITRHEGRAVTDPSLLPEGAHITTTFAKGTAESVVTTVSE
ncbi:MAG: exodeoxyribonuclease VII large subunit [Muribaculaceae bacterium]|nr:exodeoxyribonuclease VII large subunit [Muribaculaceae bacterium]